MAAGDLLSAAPTAGCPERKSTVATTVELKISLKCFLSIDQRYTKHCV